MSAKSVFTVFCYCLFFMLIYFSFVSSMKAATVEAKTTVKNSFFSLAPQGWGFFTRNPREPRLDVYTINSQGQPEKFIKQNFRAGSLFGSNKTGRVRTMELSHILKLVPDSAWLANAGNFIPSLPGAACITVPYTNKIKAFPRGEYALVFTDCLPWAWAKNAATARIPFKLIKVKIV